MEWHERAFSPQYHPVGTRVAHRLMNGFTYWRIKIAEGVWTHEHRLVAAQKLGRDLRRDEHVHHINKDTLDNRPENIEVLRNGEHIRLHHLGKRSGRWSRKFAACVNCGSTAREHDANGLCHPCYVYYRNYRKHRCVNS